jgi:hypothetical protein
MSMKKTFFAFALLFVFATVAFAQHSVMTAHSKPVHMSVTIPEYIGLNPANTAPVRFNQFTDHVADRIADGETNLIAISRTAPSWKLEYNLKTSRTVTVCAYASDLKGAGSDTIPATFISGQSINKNTGWQWFGAAADCTQGANALLLDKFASNGSSLNNGGDLTEGFSTIQVNVVPGNMGLPVPTPDTYRGHLYIVAQAL